MQFRGSVFIIRNYGLFFFLLFFQSYLQYFNPLSVKDCFHSVVLLLQYRLQPPGISLLWKTFLLLHAQLISDVTCRWLVNSWNTGVCFFFFSLPQCIPVSTNLRSVQKKEQRKLNETDWKQALCCWCPTERDLFNLKSGRITIKMSYDIIKEQKRP